MARDAAMGNEASRHFTSPVRKQRWQMIVLNSLLHAVYTSSCTMPPSFRMGLPHPVRLITIIPYRFTEKLVSLMILDPPKLIISIYHPSIIYMPLTYLPTYYLPVYLLCHLCVSLQHLSLSKCIILCTWIVPVPHHPKASALEVWLPVGGTIWGCLRNSGRKMVTGENCWDEDIPFQALPLSISNLSIVGHKFHYRHYQYDVFPNPVRTSNHRVPPLKPSNKINPLSFKWCIVSQQWYKEDGKLVAEKGGVVLIPSDHGS